MSALQANPNLLVSSLLRYAADPAQQQGNDLGKAWLITTQNITRVAWMAGDEYATSVALEGSSTAWLREIPAHILDQLCEAALQVVEQRLAAIAAGASNLPTAFPAGHVSYADFSCQLSILG